MAGVGFQLKKLFKDKEGYVDSIKAYSVSAIVIEGPMLLSIFMLLVLRSLIGKFEGTYFEEDAFVIAITYTMIFSMIFANTINLFISRYISDCIYEERYGDILSSFYSMAILLLLIGGSASGLFILGLNLGGSYKIIMFIQFNIVMITWLQLTFLSAIKKYSNILIGFFIAVAVSIVMAVVLMVAGANPLKAALIGSTSGYSTLMIIFMKEIHQFYPRGEINLLGWMKALDKYKILIVIGLFMTLGLFGHNIVMWTSEYSQVVINKMRFCMMYDIPAFYASLSIMSMMVIFTVSLETNFYIKFREYFNSILKGGRYKDIEEAYHKMRKELINEIVKMCEIQLFFTIFACMFGAIFLKRIGMDINMTDIFRMLCFGYFFYGVERCINIVLLYFDDRKGTLMSSIIFFVLSIIFTYISRVKGIDYYGLGFFAATLISSIFALFRLRYYMKNLDYYVFCTQPLFISKDKGYFENMSQKIEKIINE